ncbi:hypothetical protein JW710_04275 [Candidatus Dojkabacteria bacterium]|nr:hypothetical protein [Candidatus Dojkabacteria bacterium]
MSPVVVSISNLVVEPQGGTGEKDAELNYYQAPVIIANNGGNIRVDAQALTSDPAVLEPVLYLLTEGYREHGAADFRKESLLENHGKSQVFLSTIFGDQGSRYIESTMTAAWGGETTGSTANTEASYLTVGEDGRRLAEILGISPEEYIEFKGLVSASGIGNPKMLPTFLQLMRACISWGLDKGSTIGVAMMKPKLAIALQRMGLEFQEIHGIGLDWEGNNPTEGPLGTNDEYFKEFYPYFMDKADLVRWLRENGLDSIKVSGEPGSLERVVTASKSNLLLFRETVEANWERIRTEVQDSPKLYYHPLEQLRENIDHLFRQWQSSSN